MYPPVGPARTPTPDLKPANTGTPIKPITMYNNTEINESIGLSINIHKNTARVCSVKGTVVGIDINDITHIIDVNIAIYTKSLTFIIITSIKNGLY
jgi:hypothetical protein